PLPSISRPRRAYWPGTKRKPAGRVVLMVNRASVQRWTSISVSWVALSLTSVFIGIRFAESSIKGKTILPQIGLTYFCIGDKQMSTIVLFEKIHPSAAELLEQQGFHNIVQIPKALAGDELLAALQGA